MSLERSSGEKTRATIITETEHARTVFSSSPDNSDVRYTYANLLYQGGDFWKAWEVAEEFSKEPVSSIRERMLAARLAFLLGKYAVAERLYKELVAATQNDPSTQVTAHVDLMFTYYEQDKFDAIKALKFPEGVDLPQYKAITTFEGQPYQLDWHSEDRTSIVPFVMTDPVPLLMVEVNRVPIAVFFDTGGDLLIIDPDIASALGVEATAAAKGPFGGGQEAEFGFGQVTSLKLIDVTINNVPVMILPTKRFSDIYKGKGIVLGGVIGTSMLRQFLATLDYGNGQLILRERSAAGLKRLRAAQRGKEIVEIPFVLDYTHLMMARGSLNEKVNLTTFVDSGLAHEAKFTAPIQTLEYAGIPIPERNYVDPIGGGGGVWESGFFEVASIGLGPLVQQKVKGEYGALPPEFYWSRGYIQDFLISHRFLREYATWTLDFDRMTYIFER
jgi:hypothetical protein